MKAEAEQRLHALQEPLQAERDAHQQKIDQATAENNAFRVKEKARKSWMIVIPIYLGIIVALSVATALSFVAILAIKKRNPILAQEPITPA